jgi:uncharacterized membrane protein
MTLLIFGLLLFLGIHSISIFALDKRDQLAAKSPLGWKAVYSVISIVGLILIVQGYAAARLNPTFVYITPFWLRHLSALLMLPMFILFLAPYFPGRISRATKHPQLIAVKLWAMSHLLVNGTVADLFLFGGFLAWAVVDRISMKKRTARPLPGLPTSSRNDVIIIVLGLVLYAVFAVYLHQILIGVAPFAVS